MTIGIGSRLGPYEVLRAIGAGGMGEVYQARDSRLDRLVAIKVLPADRAGEDDLRERFEREARIVSSLNHPHICTLHDIGDAPGPDGAAVRYLVMEYLEGETLAERLRNGPLTVDQVLRYATEIADALDKAHRRGVTHRDLKPGNIMLTKSGAKLLDFGLAKASGTVAAAPGATVAAQTMSAPLTAQGTILGTFQYMAPEQLEGLEADARSDIWAFGCVLYEMLTGRRAFEGRSQTSLIAAIMHIEPAPASAVQPMTPAPLDRIVRTCLAKDPDDRWQTAHDLGLQLKWVADGGSMSGGAALPTRRGRTRQAALFAIALLVGLGLGLAGAFVLRAPDEPVLTRFTVATPDMSNNPNLVSVSPDGRMVAFVASASTNQRLLYVRPFDSVDARPLDGTDGAGNFFWSPDGRHIAFSAGGELKRVAVSGGPPQTICASTGGAGTWNAENVIVFFSGGLLQRVPAGGGVPMPLTGMDKSVKRDFPYFLPDGRRFLFLEWTSKPEDRAIWVGSLDSAERTRLMAAESKPVFAAPGYLLFHREGTLFAQRFDPSDLALDGEPFRVADDVPYNASIGQGGFSVSSTGVLVHGTGTSIGARRQLAWFDRGGRELQAIGQPGAFANFDVSPDGKRAVIWRTRPVDVDLWILEFSTGILSRFTSHPSGDLDPVWSPDSNSIVWWRSGVGLLRKQVGGRDETLLIKGAEGPAMWADDWSSDGRFVIGNVGGRSMYTLSMSGAAAPTVVFESSGGLDEPHFSPDGRWVSYSSEESGTPQIYVASFPDFTGIRQVSADGGRQPRWRRDGAELYFIGLDRRIMTVGVRPAGSTLETTAPKALFEAPMPGIADYYEPSPDGQRFLVLKSIDATQSPPLTVVLNWTAGLPQ